MTAGLLVASLVVGLGIVVGRARTPVAPRAVPVPLLAWPPRPMARRRRASPVPDLHRIRASLAAGATTADAVAAVAAGVGPWAPDARLVAAEVARGVRFDEALEAWVARSRDAAVELVADAFALASATGGSQLQAIDAVIETVREREALAREVRALGSQAQASAVLVAAAPLAFALLLSAVDGRVRSFLVGSVGGAACIALGLALDLAGAAWMRRLVRRVGR